MFWNVGARGPTVWLPRENAGRGALTRRRPGRVGRKQAQCILDVRVEFVGKFGLAPAVLVAPLAVEADEGQGDESEKDDGENGVGKPE